MHACVWTLEVVALYRTPAAACIGQWAEHSWTLVRSLPKRLIFPCSSGGEHPVCVFMCKDQGFLECGELC